MNDRNKRNREKMILYLLNIKDHGKNYFIKFPDNLWRYLLWMMKRYNMSNPDRISKRDLGLTDDEIEILKRSFFKRKDRKYRKNK